MSEADQQKQHVRRLFPGMLPGNAANKLYKTAKKKANERLKGHKEGQRLICQQVAGEISTYGVHVRDSDQQPRT